MLYECHVIVKVTLNTSTDGQQRDIEVRRYTILQGHAVK